MCLSHFDAEDNSPTQPLLGHIRTTNGQAYSCASWAVKIGAHTHTHALQTPTPTAGWLAQGDMHCCEFLKLPILPFSLLSLSLSISVFRLFCLVSSLSLSVSLSLSLCLSVSLSLCLSLLALPLLANLKRTRALFSLSRHPPFKQVLWKSAEEERGGDFRAFQLSCCMVASQCCTSVGVQLRSTRRRPS